MPLELSQSSPPASAAPSPAPRPPRPARAFAASAASRASGAMNTAGFSCTRCPCAPRLEYVLSFRRPSRPPALSRALVAQPRHQHCPDLPLLRLRRLLHDWLVRSRRHQVRCIRMRVLHLGVPVPLVRFGIPRLRQCNVLSVLAVCSSPRHWLLSADACFFRAGLVQGYLIDVTSLASLRRCKNADFFRK